MGAVKSGFLIIGFGGLIRDPSKPSWRHATQFTTQGQDEKIHVNHFQIFQTFNYFRGSSRFLMRFSGFPWVLENLWESGYLLRSHESLFDTRADRIVLWVTLAYARKYMIQHYAYAPVTKRDPRELSRYPRFKNNKKYFSGVHEDLKNACQALLGGYFVRNLKKS